MSDIAQLIEDMVRAGVAPELIGRTAAAFASHSQIVLKDEQADRRRAKDRERKRLRNSAESADSTPPSPDKEIPPTPPKEINPNPIPPSPPKGGSSPTPERNGKPWVNLQAILNPMTARAVGDHLGSKLTGPMADAMVGVLREVQQLGGNPDEACQMMIRRGWKSLDIEFLRNNGFKFSAPPKPADVDWAARLKAWRDNETWVGAWGPKPGERNCRVPANLLEHAA